MRQKNAWPGWDAVQARDFVKARWDAIQRVAAALLEQQTLDADQVRRLVFVAPAADDMAA